MSLQHDTLAYQVIGCAVEVYKALGPGLLESVYQKALLKELAYNEIHAESEVPIDVFYHKIRNLRYSKPIPNWVI